MHWRSGCAIKQKRIRINGSIKQMSRKPRHIAIVMDGNGRWAQKRFLPRVAGHRAGVAAVRRAVQMCLDFEIEYLTLFAFSSENWMRPATEVNELMSLFLTLLEKEVHKLNENNIQLKIIGDVSKFNPRLQQTILNAENLTANNTKLTLVIAANYGGRWDITQAAKKLADAVGAGEMTLDQITSQALSDNLSTAKIPEPDLLIRTSGEQRISNFLLWQLAYSELYFVPVLWPDFAEQHFKNALDFYASRERRFGFTSEQLAV